jgi:hypothetical protein
MDGCSTFWRISGDQHDGLGLAVAKRDLVDGHGGPSFEGDLRLLDRSRLNARGGRLTGRIDLAEVSQGGMPTRGARVISRNLYLAEIARFSP